MTDIHSHILHRVDDGPKSLDESIAIIKALKDGGVDRVVSTSHYYSATMSPEEFSDRRERRIAEINSRLVQEHIDVEIIPGAEVLIDRLILNQKTLKGLSYNGGRYILLEIPHADGNHTEYFELIERIMSYYNVIPVVAHVERYPFFSKCMKNVEYLKDMGCMIQLDSQCFFDTFWLKHFGYSALKKGLVDVVGSDCHDLTLRYPNLHLAYEAIQKKLGDDYVDMLKENAEMIIS